MSIHRTLWRWFAIYI